MFLKNSYKKKLYQSAVFIAVFATVAIVGDDAWAACNGGLGKSDSLGAVICNTFNSTDRVPGLLAGFSYLCGLVLGFMGIMKLKDHVESPNQVQIWDPMKRFLAGGFFFTLPFIARVVQETVAKDAVDLKAGKGYNTGGVSGTGLDAKLVNLMKDIWEPMQFLLLGFSYLAGIILILIGISRLLKTEQEGARGPMGFGTIMTFLVAGVLLSLNKILGSTVTSIFASDALVHAELSYTDGMADGGKHANAVIGAAMAFIAIIGWISFIRGFFIMRGVAEGNSQASAMAGFTHIIGGAIAVNLGAFLQAVQSTLGITAYGLKISSLEPIMTSVTFLV